MTVIAHLTDIHLPALPFPRLKELSLKRILGYLNWQRSRKYLHQLDVLTSLTDDLKLQTYQHLIVSGDLVNLALFKEFENALNWLAQFGSSDDVSFVPGNHDYYGSDPELFSTHAYGASPLLNYMTSDERGAQSGGGNGPQSPFIRIINDVAIIGVNSSCPTPPFKAFGMIDDAVLTQLKDCLVRLKGKNLYRCVVLHHPPLAGLTARRRALQNDHALTEVLSQAGAELVLYGHNHVQRYDQLETTTGFCHIVGTPSASIGQSGPYDLARYNLFTIEGSVNEWRTSLHGRGLKVDNGGIESLENRILPRSF